MQVTSLGFRTDLALLRLGGSEIEDHGNSLVVRTPDNPDYHWGNFLLVSEAPAGVAAVIDEFDAAFPDAHHRAVGIDGALGDLDAGELSVERDSVLTAQQLRAPSRPNTDADYRPLHSDLDWRQLVELEVTCFDDGSMPEFGRFTERRVAVFRRWAEAGHGAWWGAFVDDALVAGMGLFRAGDGLARFQNVETRPDFRGRGLAGTLAHRVGSWGLTDLGADRLVIVADPDADAIRIYRSLGFVDAEPMTQLYQARRTG